MAGADKSWARVQAEGAEGSEGAEGMAGAQNAEGAEGKGCAEGAEGAGGTGRRCRGRHGVRRKLGDGAERGVRQRVGGAEK